jgi:hypothetical protein
MENFMEVGQGPNLGCNAKEKNAAQNSNSNWRTINMQFLKGQF